MTAEHPNAALIRRLFAAFDSRDVASVLDVLAEDAVWRFPGTKGQLAGEHHGRDAILQFLGKVAVLTEGTFHLQLEDVIAGESGGVALFRGSGRRNGQTLDNPTALVIRIEGGRVVELREFVWDLAHVEAFWA